MTREELLTLIKRMPPVEVAESVPGDHTHYYFTAVHPRLTGKFGDVNPAEGGNDGD